MSNSRKYFDETYGMTLNSKCKICKRNIWVQEGIHTRYHGKKYLHNRTNEIMSINHFSYGALCEKCFNACESEGDQ